MNRANDELLSQYIDGELDTEQRQSLSRRLLADPTLRARYDTLKAADDKIRSAFSAPATATVPNATRMLLQTPAMRSRANRRHWGLAVAASLTAVTALALLSTQWRQSPVIDAPLARALESLPSRGAGWDTLEDGRQVRTVLTYATHDGQWCREYLLVSQASQLHGVSCRESGHWQSRVSVPTQFEVGSQNYRAAGSNDSADVAAFIESSAADIALNRESEAELIGRHWR